MIYGAVLGSPIEHSLSPLLHQSAFSFLGIEGKYDRIEVKSGDLANFLKSEADKFDYLSLTMPLKEEVLNLKVSVSAIATKSQSANTMVKSSGQWTVTSTDGLGFMAALKFRGFSDFSSVLILGAGGTARAVAAALDGLADSITVLGRSQSRKSPFSQIVTKSPFTYAEWTNSFSMSGYSLVVNTTPAGAADLLADNLSVQPSGLLFDVIYKPWPTVLASRWLQREAPVISGIELLIYQGIEQIRIVTGLTFDEEELARHLRSRLQGSL